MLAASASLLDEVPLSHESTPYTPKMMAAADPRICRNQVRILSDIPGDGLCGSDCGFSSSESLDQYVLEELSVSDILCYCHVQGLEVVAKNARRKKKKDKKPRHQQSAAGVLCPRNIQKVAPPAQDVNVEPSY
jgi:hypothetical protein